ncbi:hypothetical protein F5Y03DRAFT_370032, partial [Xylaria venustula]
MGKSLCISLKTSHVENVFSTFALFFMIIAIILATVANLLNYKLSSILVSESPSPSEAELANIIVTLRKWNVTDQTLFL